MKSYQHQSCGALAALVSIMNASARADEIIVEPGEGTISAAIAKTKPGDVIMLKAGEYRDSVKAPKGITIKGAGADQTILIATDYAGVSIAGPEVTIIGIEFRSGGEKTVRGISSDQAVRIERCRFITLPEAVALREAPLSDVINCEFKDCRIGVRSIGGASPTIWGCAFHGGDMGVFAMDGGPNIRHNLFHECATGLRLISKEPHVMIIRNNVFINCKTAGIEIKYSTMPFGVAAIRNNIFVSDDAGSAAVIGSSELTTLISHDVVHGFTDLAVRDAQGKPSLEVDKASILKLDPGVKLAENGEVSCSQAEALADKGIRDCHIAEGAAAPIGLGPGFERPGSNPKEIAAPPPIRWNPANYIANAVGEEYLCLKMWRASMGGQGLINKDGKSFDELEITRDGKNETVRFDITGFHCEMSMGR